MPRIIKKCVQDSGYISFAQAFYVGVMLLLKHEKSRTA